MELKLSRSSLFNLFYIAFCILWTPLRLYYIPVDGAKRIILLLTVVGLIVNINSFRNIKTIIQTPAFKCWTILLVYSLINTLIKGFDSEWGTLTYLRTEFIDNYILMLFIFIELNKDKSRCLRVLLYALLLFVLIVNAHSSTSFFEDRFMSEGMGNMLPLICVACAFVACVLFVERRFKREWLVFSIIIVFLFFSILASGTRKAFGALVLVLIGTVLGRVNKLNVKSFISVLFAFGVLFIAINTIVKSSITGKRIEEQQDVKVEAPIFKNSFLNNVANKFLDDRAIQYSIAMEIYHQHPLTGVGLNNYDTNLLSYSNLHSEWMTQLCENGIIGFVLLLLFYFLIFRDLNRQRKIGNNTFLFMFGIFAVMFINFTAWTYNMVYVMIIYSIVFNQLSFNYKGENSNSLYK